MSRVLALAEALRDTADIVFHTRCRIDDVLQGLSAQGQLVVMNDIGHVSDEADRFAQGLRDDDMVVLDGNQFDEAYQAAIKRRGCILVCVDDVATRVFRADLIINDSGGITPDQYRCATPARFCLGPQFAILRGPFLHAARARRPFVPNANVLVCLGGADPNNEVLRVLDVASTRMRHRHFHVVVGAAYQHGATLRDFLDRTALSATIHTNLRADEMAELMSRCGAAVTPPSTVSLEYASVGGVLYVHQIASDQTYTHRWLIEQELALPFAEFSFNCAAEERVVRRQRETFDGRSDERLRESIEALAAV
jgi:spore coat polysaccharide biosynthesis predicted glycosyltransferase SpsG